MSQSRRSEKLSLTLSAMNSGKDGQKDQIGKARNEKFLGLWKDADPLIAEVEEARERLAGLKN